MTKVMSGKILDVWQNQATKNSPDWGIFIFVSKNPYNKKMAVFRVFVLLEYDKSLINFIVIQLKRVVFLYVLIRIGLILLSDDNRDYYMLLFLCFVYTI